MYRHLYKFQAVVLMTPSLELFDIQGLEPSGHQLAEIILVEHGHVGLTVNPIILKDICRLMHPLLLEHRLSFPSFPLCTTFKKINLENK